MRILAITLAGIVFLIPAPAQKVTSEILGNVTDASGGLVPGVKVSALRVDTGELRQTTTGDDGSYLVDGLSSGTYEVHLEKQGFKTEILTGIPLLVNQQVTLNATIQLGDLHEQVNVVGQISLLEEASSGLSGVVTSPTLHELPLNGRDLLQLTLLQPGVLSVTSAGPNPFAEGGTSKVAVQGSRPVMNNVTLDGADINDAAYGLPSGGVAGIQLGVDAIQEFRVLLNNYSAEFGRNAGANVQYITRSGSNELHGALFEFHRNAALDARNFFDVGKIPGFVRNQFGEALGGPIRKNRTFFFNNFENLLESKSITVNLSVPDANARLGLLPSATDPTKLVNIGVDPRVAPFLKLYPMPNGGSLGGGLALLQTSARQPTAEHYGLMRLDQTQSDRDHFFARYVIDDSSSTVPFANTVTPGFPSDRAIRNQYMMLSWQRILSPTLLNEAKFNFSRVSQSTREAYSSPESISLSPDRALGAITIGGLPQLGSSLVSPVASYGNTFEFLDNVSKQHGAHAIRAGIDVKRLQNNGYYDALINGSYIFSDLSPFGIPSRTANPALEFFLQAVPLIYLGVDPAASDSHRGYRQTYVGTYLQDDWKVARNLTVNLGVRWEYWGNIGEANGRLSNIPDVATSLQPQPGKIWASVPLNLWSPRLGFSWKPWASSQWVVRGGAGIMRDQFYGNMYGTTRFFQPYYRALQYILPNFQAPPQSTQSLIGFGGPPSVIGIFGMTYRPKFPYYEQYNLNVQRQLPGGFLLQVAYVGSKGVHLPRGGEANPFLAQLGRRLNPNFGSEVIIVTDGQSSYNSGQLSLERRFAKGLSFQLSYTLSKSLDDQSGNFPSDFTSESGVAQNLFDRTGDRGRSSFDRRNVLVLNSLYDLHLGKGKLAGGWSIGGIASVASGAPFTANLGSFNNSLTQALANADRPNLRAGANPCSNTGNPNHWFDPTLFTLPAPAAFGNAGRNIMCGPGLANVDFLVTKSVSLSERVRLQLRVEIFNVLNHANFDSPVNTQGPTGGGGNGDAVFVGRQSGNCSPATDSLGCGLLAPDAGKIFRTVTPSRQIQLGVRLSF